jgi:hypothetical protein
MYVNMKELISANGKLAIKIHGNNLQDSAKKMLKAGWEVSSLSSDVCCVYV